MTTNTALKNLLTDLEKSLTGTISSEAMLINMGRFQGVVASLPQLPAGFIEGLNEDKNLNSPVSSIKINGLCAHLRFLLAHSNQQPMPSHTASTKPPKFSVFTQGDVALEKKLLARWHEVNASTKAKAYTAAVVMAGSLIEAMMILCAQQHETEVRAAAAKLSQGRSHTRYKPHDPIEKWSSVLLIDVMFELGWVNEGTKNIAHNVRQLRNNVHLLASKTEHTSTEHTCQIAVSTLMQAYEQLAASV